MEQFCEICRMEAASIKDLRAELARRSPKELQNLVLELAKFKKESKEFLTYLLFESEDEQAFVRRVMEEMDAEFDWVDRRSSYTARKQVRKILRMVKQYIRFSKKLPTEIALLLHYCRNMKGLGQVLYAHPVLENLYTRQLEMAKKKLPKLHEDLQYDFQREIEDLEAYL